MDRMPDLGELCTNEILGFSDVRLVRVANPRDRDIDCFYMVKEPCFRPEQLIAGWDARHLRPSELVGFYRMQSRYAYFTSTGRRVCRINIPPRGL